MSGAGHDTTHRWTFGLRLLTNQIPRASVRTTLTYRFHERVQAGVEYNPRADEVGVIANVLLLRETEKRPCSNVAPAPIALEHRRANPFMQH